MEGGRGRVEGERSKVKGGRARGQRTEDRGLTTERRCGVRLRLLSLLCYGTGYYG